MLRLFLASILALGTVSHVSADAGLVTKQSGYSMRETIERLETAIKEAGATLWIRIDLKAAAVKGETLRPHQLVIFGRGGSLEPFLSAASNSGIDLPQKILVFEDQTGKVWMVYNTGEYIVQRHGIKGQDATVAGINRVVGSITDKVAK